MQCSEYYKKLGLKCGIEIHRQLDTGKLFCRCSSAMQDEPTGEVMRRLRATAGELGKLDPAALHEALKAKEFIYNIYPNESCLVELDEEPPGEPDKNAFEASLLVSVMLNAVVPDEVHFMRKNVIDGSNTGGFQRTGIVGIDGHLDVSFGRVGITNISLEEDSAQILGKEDGRTIFGLNRLGIPLVEIGTSPDIKTPKQAREVAEKIGTMLKSTGRVKRGLGTIRQDVNVSIKGGARIEIKGAQDLKTIPELVASEAERQKSLVALKKEVKKKDLKKQQPKIINATNILTKTESRIFAGKEAFAIKLSGFSGMFKTPLNSHRALGREISNYACAKAGVKGIVHSDEDIPKYGIEKEFSVLKKKLGAKKADIIVIVAAPEKTAKTALNTVVERVNMIFKGVPEETRRALQSGDAEYMRPLPGAARMYPETDLLPIPVTKEMLSGIKEKIPESYEDKRERFIKLGLNNELTGQIINSEYLPVFEQALSLKVPAKDIANVFLNTVPDLKARDGIDTGSIHSDRFLELFSLFEKKKIGKDAFPILIASFAKNPGKTAEFLLKKACLSKMSETEARKIIQEIIAKEKNKNPGYLTGKCIQALKGRIENGVVARIVREET